MFDTKHGLRPCAVAFAVALALGLSGCGGGGGANVRPSTPPPSTGTGDFAGGDINVSPGATTVWPNNITGSIDLIKGGAGTLVLAGTDSYTGGTTINDGTLQIGNGGITGSITGNVVDNALLVFDRSDNVTFNGIVSGNGSLTQAGTGTLTLTGASTYTGGTTISSGTLQLGSGGTTGSITGNVTNNGSLAFDHSDDVTFNGIVSGSGSLKQAGTGTLTLTGTNTYTGGTTISSGTLQLGNGGTTGSSTGNVTNNGSLAFDHSDDVTFNGMVSGSGSLRQAGTGTLTLTGTNTYTSGTTISSGTLQLGNGGTTGSIMGNVNDRGTLAFDRSDDVSFAGTVTGTGGLNKTGNGALTLTGANSYTGATQVTAGSLYVDADQSAATGATTVANGVTLGGKGTLGGDVTVAEGATLAPGDKGAIGTLTVNGNLNLSAGSTLDYGFGQATTGGGQLSDLINVNGNLTLDGALNVSVAPGDDLGPGVYHLINYDGTLVDNGLDLGSNASGLLVQTGLAHQVNLVNTQGMTFSFWDGDAGPKGNNAINGGDGTWESGNSLSNNNWTDAGGTVNATFSDRSFAVFQATPGTVTVNDGNGDVNAAGIQFASNGYVVQGDAIHLVGSTDDPTHSVIRVGDGTTAGAGYTATINSVLDGTSALVKADAGTLVLGGANTYTGGTTINQGTLQIGSGGTIGSITGNVTNNAALVFSRSNNPSFNGIVSGSGSLTQAGAGTLTLTGNSTYTGGTTISGGTLQIGNTSTTGSIIGNITDNGVLIFDRIDDVVFNGDISGSGALVKNGPYLLTLTGNNTYTGITTINQGTLQIGNGGTTGLITGDVIDNAYNGSLVFDRSDDWNYGGVISGSGGVVKLGNGTLTISGVNTFTGGAFVKAGTLKIAAGGALNTGIFVGGANQNATLKIDPGATASIGVVLQDGGTLDNAGTILAQAPQGSAVRQYDFFNSSVTIVNHDGGLIESDSLESGPVTPAVSVGQNSTLTNGVDSTIRGYVGVSTQGVVNNAGGTITGIYSDGIDGSATLVNNTDGGHITSGITGPFNFLISSGVKTLASNTVVNNVGGSTIAGRGFGTYFFNGGTVTNDNASLISGNTAILIGSNSNATGLVNNIGGSTITGTAAGIVLQYGGTVTNGPGSTIQATATASGDCSVTLACSIFVTSFRTYEPNGTLNLTNAGAIVGDVQMDPTVINDITLITGGYIHGALKIGTNAQSALTLDGSAGTTQLYSNAVTGATTFGGILVKNGTGTWVIDDSDLQGVVDTSINAGSLRATQVLSGNVTVNATGNLDGVPGVADHLTNAGKVAVHGGDSTVGGNYAQSSTGTLAVGLGSKLAISGTATLNGGTLEVTGADSGYVSSTHTNVLTATGGLTGTFGQLTKDTGVVFTATTINYDANSVWLDTTGLNVTTAAAGNGVSYTPASFGSAQRVQGAFNQLDNKIAAGNLSGVSGAFLHAAGQFQQSRTLQAAQASLQSLSGELHAASASMTFEAIDAASRALSDRFDNLLDKGTGYGMWTHDLSTGGDMARAGFNSVGFQLNGWLVGNDRQIGRSGVAGYAFGQSRSQQRQGQSYDHDNSRSTEGMLYAGWLYGNWYTQGRVGFGHVQQDINRQILLGDSAQGVGTQYNGGYSVAYSESGLHFGRGNSHLTPFVDVQYARINRDGFAEQGAGGFGLRSNAQTLDRWQAGLGVRASHHWNLDGGRAMDFSAHAQWQRTLASHGEAFDASFVGLQQWQPLVGIGLSRYSGLFGVGMDATLSKRTTLNFSYDYEMGQRDNAQTLSARLNVAI